MFVTVQLDPEGDAVLSINSSGGNKRYLVSSRVLSLASPVFSKLFGPNFKEGQATRRGDCPCISLEEDNPEAMGLILRVLHYKYAQVSLPMKPAALATLAVHCDKYGCNEALMPWAAHWCSKLKDVAAPEDLGFMLLAAYMFRSSSFSEVAARAVSELPPDFASVWAEHEVLALLPETITAALSDLIADGLDKLHQELQSTEGRLRSEQSYFPMPGILCTSCGRDLPAEARQCRRCCTTDLFKKICNTDYRVAEYFAVLTRCGLWPSIEPFTTMSLSNIVSRFKCAVTDHQCGASASCPLKCEQVKLSHRAQQALDNVKGRCLEEVDII
ncbi:hypothetical protein V8C26DRAFT_397482 [Trichoderma gracile]